MKGVSIKYGLVALFLTLLTLTLSPTASAAWARTMDRSTSVAVAVPSNCSSSRFTSNVGSGLFNQLPAPNCPCVTSTLRGVAALSSSDIWAVGYYQTAGLRLNQTLIEHWDGVKWSVVPSPNVGATVGLLTLDNYLYAVAALSANDIWAVGVYNAYDTQTLIEHWDGGQWSIVPSPNPQAPDVVLRSVAAVSANDVWAVGSDGYGLATRTVIEHWDGSQWSIVQNPNPGQLDVLNGVAATSTGSVWAVGSYVNNGDLTLTEYWNGSQWSVVQSPNASSVANFLNGVTAVSSSDIWAVGNYLSNARLNQTLTEHWDGSQWSIIPSANANGTLGSLHNYLTAVTAVSTSNVWAVGLYGNPYNNNTQTLTEHWNGSQWSVVPSPSPGHSYVNELNGVTAVSTNDVWAVGDYKGRQLIEHWNGANWQVVPGSDIRSNGFSRETAPETAGPVS